MNIETLKMKYPLIKPISEKEIENANFILIIGRKEEIVSKNSFEDDIEYIYHPEKMLPVIYGQIQEYFLFEERGFIPDGKEVIEIYPLEGFCYTDIARLILSNLDLDYLGDHLDISKDDATLLYLYAEYLNQKVTLSAKLYFSTENRIDEKNIWKKYNLKTGECIGPIKIFEIFGMAVMNNYACAPVKI